MSKWDDLAEIGELLQFGYGTPRRRPSKAQRLAYQRRLERMRTLSATKQAERSSQRRGVDSALAESANQK